MIRFQPPPGLRDDPALGVASGVLGAPLLTVKTSGDLWTPISLDRSYARRVQAAGYGDFLVQRAVRRAGHCNFTEQDEVLRALLDLTRWATEGVRPEGEDLTGDDLSGVGVRFTSPFDADDPLAPSRPLAAAATADRLAPLARGEVAHPLGPELGHAFVIGRAGPGLGSRGRGPSRQPMLSASASANADQAQPLPPPLASWKPIAPAASRPVRMASVVAMGSKSRSCRWIAPSRSCTPGTRPARAVAEAALEERIARDQRQRPHEGQPGDQAGLAAVAGVRDRAGHEEAEQGRRRGGRAERDCHAPMLAGAARRGVRAA